VVADRSNPAGHYSNPGAGWLSVQAVRLALNANAIGDFSLHRDELEAIISEARAEGIAEAAKLVDAADGLAEKDRERLIIRLRQL